MIVPPIGSSGSSSAQISIRAVNDGGVIIDGQFSNNTFNLNGNSWWVFQGFDVGNSVATVAQIYKSNNNIFRRICAYHANPNAASQNEHVWINWDSANNLYEDICGFGYGRNTLLDYGGSSLNNTYRRAWLSFQGYSPRFVGGNCGDHPGPQIQASYGTIGPGRFENIITVYNPERQNEFAQWTCGYGAGSSTNGVVTTGMYSFSGFIAYGYDGPVGGGTPYKNDPKTTLRGPAGGFWWGHYAYPNTDTDIFIDARSQDQVPPIVYACNYGASCSVNTSDRITVIRGATENTITAWGAITNLNSCTALEGCPNFYTGSNPGRGSRACFQYNNGSLTTMPLWPWPMDDRIKAALARTKARQLDGSAGTGYAANTVTSEIVTRLGTIPDQCRTPSGVAPLPATQLRVSSLFFAPGYSPLALGSLLHMSDR